MSGKTQGIWSLKNVATLYTLKVYYDINLTFDSYGTQNLALQRITVITTQKIDFPLFAIFRVIVYLHTIGMCIVCVYFLVSPGPIKRLEVCGSKVHPNQMVSQKIILGLQQRHQNLS